MGLRKVDGDSASHTSITLYQPTISSIGHAFDAECHEQVEHQPCREVFRIVSPALVPDPHIAHMAGSIRLQVCASIGGALESDRHAFSIPLDLQRPEKVFVSGTLDASKYLARVAPGDVFGWRAARCRDDAIVAYPDAKSAVPDRTPLCAATKASSRAVAPVSTQLDDDRRDDHV